MMVRVVETLSFCGLVDLVFIVDVTGLVQEIN